MKKRRTPSEQRAEKLNRYLAELVLRPPGSTNTHNMPPSSSRAHKTDRKGKGKTKVRVKEESVEPELRFDDRERELSASPMPIIKEAGPADKGKVIAMNLVDFGLVLSLVFGGCCR